MTPRCLPVAMVVVVVTTRVLLFHVVAAEGESSSDSDSTTKTNHIFIKTPKCASSTSAGIARRLAAHANLSHWRDGAISTPDPAFKDDVEPKVYANHVTRRDLDAHSDIRKLRLPVFPRWTMIRNPAERALSAYYFFQVKRDGGSTADDAVIRGLREKDENMLFRYISPEHCASSLLETTAEESSIVECVLDAYDFVGVVELFDESMLQLAAVVGAPLASILYLPSKVSNNSDDSNAVNHGLQAQSPAVRAYLASNAWLQKHSLDYKLWETVHRRVARNAIGHEGRLLVYRDMLKDVTDKCTTAVNIENATTGPCPASSPGYWNDNGCGFECFDAMYGN